MPAQQGLNPQFAITNFSPVHVPIQPRFPERQFLRFDLKSGQFITVTPSQEAKDAQGLLSDPLGLQSLRDRISKTWDDNLVNVLVGVVGLALIFYGIGSLASPAVETAVGAAAGAAI